MIALSALAAFSAPGLAQTYPAKPVRIVVPFDAGVVDAVARALAQKLSEQWGQPVIIENRPGGGTVIAAGLVAKSPPDGYTLLVAAADTLVINPSLMPNISYSPSRDFAMVRGIFAVKHILVAHPTARVTTLPELVAQLKENPGKLFYASAGIGGPQHLNMERFLAMANVSATHLPLKGAGSQLTELLSGRATFGLASIGAVLASIRAGRLRPIALASDKRNAVVPDVPTFAEGGFPGYDSVSWFALVAPSGTPPAILDRISNDTAAIMNLPEIRDKRLLDQGLEPFTLAQDQLSSLVARESERYSEIIRRIGAAAN
jgi:tripartite-type tricarboxylate transporter receptor subunit TctC